MPITVRDVARHLGLSVPTVIQSLAGTGRISESTRARVRATAEQLGYRPHSSARALSSRQTRNVAVILHDPSAAEADGRQILAPHGYEFLIGIDQVLAPQGYASSIVRMTALERDPAASSRLLREQAVDGAIVQVALAADATTAVMNGIKHIIWLDCGRRDAHDCVWRDEESAGRFAAEAAIRAGAKNLVFIDQQRGLPKRAAYDHAVRRLDGVMQAAKPAGLPVTMVADLSEVEQLSGVGLVASDYPSALAVLDALSARPCSDAILTCCDDIGLTHRQTPRIRSVPYDRLEAGRVAARLLLQQLAGGETASVIVPASAIT